MKKRIILIIASVVLATFAMLLIKVYLDRQTQIIESETKQELSQRQEQEAAVLVANTDIAKGATIAAEVLAIQTMGRDSVQPQAVGAPERVIGMITLIPISRGEQITLNKLVSAKEATAAGSSLAMLTPVGKRAITIQVDNIASLLGMIKAGDYVDVVVAIPIPMQTQDKVMSQQPAVIPLFQNVLVLAVGREIGSGAQYREERYQQQASPDATPPMTLALSPSEANLLAFVQEQGRVRLVLRSPADANIEPVTPASWDTVFQYMMMNVPQAQNPEDGKTSSPTAGGREIEIYRGLRKESLTLSQ